MTEVLEMLPVSAGLGQRFQARVHSFLTIRTDPKPVNWLTSGPVIELAYEPSTNHSQNERVTQILDQERCIKEQVYFELLYLWCI